MTQSYGAILRSKLEERRGLVVPGAANALAARVIADLGFEAVYLSGAGVSNTYYGIPDMGFVGLREMADHTAAIRDAIDIPLIVDGDTGFGNALNVRHTVRVFERAGANAIQLEDQVMPKRCGHFTGKDVVPLEEMVMKIKAAIDARVDPDFLIVARTDSCAMHGFDHALDRAAAFIEAGADVTFVEAVESTEEMRRVTQHLKVPQVVNLVVGGKTPIMEHSELCDMGFALVLYANAALQGAVAGMQTVLDQLKKSGRLDEGTSKLVSFAERQRLVQKPLFDTLEKKYGVT